MFIWLIWYGQGTNSCLYQGRCQRITCLCCWGVWWHGWTAGNYFPQFFPIDNHKFKKIEFFIFLQLSWKSLQIMLILVQKLFAFLYWTLSFFFNHVLMILFQCPCKLQYGGEFCDQCAEGYYNYPECTRMFLFFIWMRMSEYYFDNCLFLKYTLWYLFQFSPFCWFFQFIFLFTWHSVRLQLVQLREYDLQHWWRAMQVKYLLYWNNIGVMLE